MALTLLELPADIHYRLSLYLPLEDLSCLAQINQTFAILFQEEKYWHYRFQQHYYPHIQGEIRVKSWKTAYLNFGQIYLRVQFVDPRNNRSGDEPAIGKLRELPVRGYKFQLGINAIFVWDTHRDLVHVLHWVGVPDYTRVDKYNTRNKLSYHKLTDYTSCWGCPEHFDFMIASTGALYTFGSPCPKSPVVTRIETKLPKYPTYRRPTQIKYQYRAFIYTDRNQYVHCGPITEERYVEYSCNGRSITDVVEYSFDFNELTMKAKQADMYDHLLVLDLDDNVWAAGANECGQLGTGDNISIYLPQQPVQLPNIKAKQVACGCTYSLILDLTGQVHIFGRIPEKGEPELDNNVPPTYRAPVIVPGIRAIQITVGWLGNCAILDTDHNVWEYSTQNQFRQIPGLKALRIDACVNKLAILAHPSPV